MKHLYKYLNHSYIHIEEWVHLLQSKNKTNRKKKQGLLAKFILSINIQTLDNNTRNLRFGLSY